MELISLNKIKHKWTLIYNTLIIMDGRAVTEFHHRISNYTIHILNIL